MRRCRYDTRVELGACSTPMSSKIDTDSDRPMRWATASMSASATPHRSANSESGTRPIASRTGSRSTTCVSRNVASTSSSRTRTASDRGDAVGIGARPDLEEVVGELGGLGAPGVDDDHGTLGIVGDLLEHPACFWQPVTHPRVLAEEHGHLGVFPVAAGVGPVEATFDVGLSGLLLRECIGSVAHPECVARARRRRRRRGGCPVRRCRIGRSTPLRGRRGPQRGVSATSAIAVSHDTCSWVPSARRRIGNVRRSRAFW